GTEFTGRCSRGLKAGAGSGARFAAGAGRASGHPEQRQDRKDDDDEPDDIDDAVHLVLPHGFPNRPSTSPRVPGSGGPRRWPNGRRRVTDLSRDLNGRIGSGNLSGNAIRPSAGGHLAPNAPRPAQPSDDASGDSILRFPDNRLLIDLCGELDRNIAQIESGTGVMITRRGNELALHGEPSERALAERVLLGLYDRLEKGRAVGPGDIDAALRMTSAGGNGGDDRAQLDMFGDGARVEIRTRKKVVEPRTAAQRAYVEQLFRHELVFGLGPAGTRNTCPAVAG